MPHYDKVIVTNQTVLRQKYGAAGFKTITAALKRLIAADKKRGLDTKLLALDSATVMKRVRGKAVTKPSDPRQNKAAIDAIYRATTPDYLVLLGAADVIPHQDVTNPIKDDDPIAYGDLPYACDAAYSRRIQDFRAPTRVVGRVPDVQNGSDASYLAEVLNVGATYMTRSRADYEAYLGITARVWSKSTALSLANTFGGSAALQEVPPKTWRWSKPLLATRSHFINCHGAPADPHFYGQQGSQYPIAHDSAYLEGRVTSGTVVAAECCYGAQLYDPAAAAGVVGMANRYLANGAYAFFGSTTIAYGPSSGNGSADLICQYFLQRVLDGASLGRAALEARQEFIQAMSALDPADLKTLAQFNLLGDPAVHPVEAPKPALTTTRAYAKAIPESPRLERTRRRQKLVRDGIGIGAASSAATPSPAMRPKAAVRKALESAARESGMRDMTVTSYKVSGRPPLPKEMKSLGTAPTAFHVAVGQSSEKSKAPIVGTVLLIATEGERGLVGLRRLHAR